MRVFEAMMAATMCLLAAQDAGAQLRGLIYAGGFSSPVAFVQDPTDRTVQFVVQQGGRIRVVRSGTVLTDDFLTLTTSTISTGGERGLLGMAIAPDYATSRRFFVYYTNPQGNLAVARFQRSAGNPLVADPNTKKEFVWLTGQTFIAHPGQSNHNGGTLAFGPDGYLYAGTGDGGSGNDPPNNAQNPQSLLGKILRLDVNVPDNDIEGYNIPPDNPFLDNIPIPALPHIWAFGVRNPWKFTFDDVTRGGTGAMLIGDVGQSAWEEIDYEPRGLGGRNYGWRNREGAHNTNITPALPPAYMPLIDPISEYGRTDGQSTTGGYVYRGQALGANFRGRYFFADYFGKVWSIRITVLANGEGQASDRQEHTAELGGSAQIGNISSFGVDADGELYIVNHSAGSIVRILPLLSAPPSAPTNLRIVP